MLTWVETHGLHSLWYVQTLVQHRYWCLATMLGPPDSLSIALTHKQQGAIHKLYGFLCSQHAILFLHNHCTNETMNA